MEHRFQAGQVNTSIFFLRALPIFPLSVISAAAGLCGFLLSSLLFGHSTARFRAAYFWDIWVGV